MSSESNDRGTSIDSARTAESMGNTNEWETIRTDRCGRQHIVFLPKYDGRDQDAFIIAERSAVVELVDFR